MNNDYDLLIDEQLKQRHRLEDHPCFSREAHGKKGRLHLPIAPACNIQCRFCTRARNDDEQCPGTARGLLRVEEAVDTVARALELCPEITVVGVAGPGDALATPHAIKAFEEIHAVFPHLILCLSTNGLNLPGKAALLREIGVATLTVTVNAVDSVIGERIVSHIVAEGQRLTGEGAARLLILRQLSGIREAAREGLSIKVNTVLIPGVNDGHVAEIAKAAALAGASFHNIIPLIPRHELADIPAPSCGEINDAREQAERFLPQFRHCRQCRADACGILGGVDLAEELYGGRRMETFSHG